LNDIELNNTVIFIIVDVYNRWKKRDSWRKQYIERSVHWKKKIVSWCAVLNEAFIIRALINGWSTSFSKASLVAHSTVIFRCILLLFLQQEIT
jgi:hypothetical protein